MKYLMTMALLLAGAVMLSSCTSPTIKDYEGTQPKADIKQFFNGPIKAWGIVQDWRGKVVSRFDIDMQGSWNGDKGTLEEDFTYYSGDTQRRVWHITKLSDGNYEGRASDILDKATGEQAGGAVRWKYVMDLPVDGSTYRLTFDDWMWQMNDGVLINRSYMRKFGFTVAELTIFMQKQEP